MAASKSKSAKTQSGRTTKRYAPPDVKIPKKLGGGILKELVERSRISFKVHRQTGEPRIGERRYRNQSGPRGEENRQTQY